MGIAHLSTTIILCAMGNFFFFCSAEQKSHLKVLNSFCFVFLFQERKMKVTSLWS